VVASEKMRHQDVFSQLQCRSGYTIHGYDSSSDLSVTCDQVRGIIYTNNRCISTNYCILPVDNLNYNIDEYYVEIMWYYLSPCPNFYKKLPESVRTKVDSIKHFPNIGTLYPSYNMSDYIDGSNLEELISDINDIVKVNLDQALLISALSGWVCKQIFIPFLKGEAYPDQDIPAFSNVIITPDNHNFGDPLLNVCKIIVKSLDDYIKSNVPDSFNLSTQEFPQSEINIIEFIKFTPVIKINSISNFTSISLNKNAIRIDYTKPDNIVINLPLIISGFNINVNLLQLKFTNITNYTPAIFPFAEDIYYQIIDPVIPINVQGNLILVLPITGDNKTYLNLDFRNINSDNIDLKGINIGIETNFYNNTEFSKLLNSASYPSLSDKLKECIDDNIESTVKQLFTSNIGGSLINLQDLVKSNNNGSLIIPLPIICEECKFAS
jgi:hypothetical protein